MCKLNIPVCCYSHYSSLDKHIWRLKCKVEFVLPVMSVLVPCSRLSEKWTGANLSQGDIAARTSSAECHMYGSLLMEAPTSA